MRTNIVCWLIMFDFLQDLVFNQISFIIGFLAGALGFWLVTKLRPALPGIAQGIRTKSRKGTSRLISGNANRLSQDMLRHVQGLHLASPLFALDEVLVEPRVLAPPKAAQPGEESLHASILDEILPYIPDWPELAARYSAKTFSLATALSAGANLVLTGSPGSGKTTALAHLVCQVVRNELSEGDFPKLIPVYTHVADLFPSKNLEQPLIDVISETVQHYCDSLSGNRLESLLNQSFQDGRILLLVDGLDEVDGEYHTLVVKYLSNLLAAYPNTRMVVTANPENYTGLIGLDFVPVSIAAWNGDQYLAFINKWARSWYRHIRPLLDKDAAQIDPRLLNAWQLAENPIISPFDATLKAWAIFSGDLAGPGYLDALESYVWRLTSNLKESRTGLEDFALQLVAAQEIALDLKQARGLKTDLEFAAESSREQSAAQKEISKRGKRSTRKLPGVLPDLLTYGILSQRRADRISFSHPLVMAYLASAALVNAPVSHFLSGQSDWTGKSLTLFFLATSRESSPEINEIFSESDDPLLRSPLSISRWLRYTLPNTSWRSKILRFLSSELQRNNIPLGLRARLLCALLFSGDAGVSVLLRQISHTTSDEMRQLSALGMGYLLDRQSLNRLSELIAEPDSNVSRAACFALGIIGNQQALELLGSALLHGGDGVRHAVAEALALDPGEGHEMLKEAAQMDDLLVRRAAVFGLARVNQPWAKSELNRLALEDKEWVVRSAATQIVERENEPDSHIPSKPLPLHEIPWLVAFAGARGIGIAPGQPAENLLLTALAEGTQEEQLAAMECLQQHPNQDALPLVYENYEFGHGSLQQAAFNTLASYAAQGLNIDKPPAY
jgi:HEAT repeat protein